MKEAKETDLKALMKIVNLYRELDDVHRSQIEDLKLAVRATNGIRTAHEGIIKNQEDEINDLKNKIRELSNV